MRTFINGLQALVQAYRRLPMPVQIMGILVMLGLMAVGTMLFLNKVLLINTCPWWPPDGCPKDS